MIQQYLKSIFKELQQIFPEYSFSKQEVILWFKHYLYLLKLANNINGNTLEIGAGFGVLATGLAKQQHKTVFSIEHPSRDFFYKKEYIEYLLNNNVHLVGCDISDGLPFKTQSFELICCCDVIEHLYPQQINILRDEIKRIIKPTGYLILSTPNLGRIQNIWRLTRGEPINPTLSIDMFGSTFGHIREFVPIELIDIFSDFENKKISYKSLSPVDGYFFNKKGKILSTIGYFVPKWREEFYLLMKRR